MTTHLYRMFVDGVVTSSFVLTSTSDPEAVPDSQTSQRVSRTPPPPAPHIPPQMPPLPSPVAPHGAPDPALAAGVHPDFLVPPSARYASYTVGDLLAQHG
ncbi:hypothetical protein N665_0021s0007 [Sinapis alba]|nr:hypothetical protein N665_0021s0007 [Sinapis alba]